MNAKVVHSSEVVEINTYEQLRDLDDNSNQLQSDAIDIISQALNVKPYEIEDITVLKKGMTNRSFLFASQGQKYIMRIPGEGTDQLINRAEEASVYKTIDGLGICDATSFDSIALTASCYSYKKLEEGEQPNRLIQLMWCILLILLPMALIFAESSMNNLQSVSIVAAFPIAIVIILIIASFLKDAGKYMDEK